MKFYKSPNNEIFAYESDGSQDSFIPDNFISVTEQEAEQIKSQNRKKQWEETSLEQKLEKCKREATALLFSTDWSTMSDVGDSSKSPFLKNKDEFIAWRSEIRKFIVDPTPEPVFPPTPTAVWG